MRAGIGPLLHAIAERDEGALRRLLDATHDRLLGIVHAVLRDRAEAEDALMDTYEQVWRLAGSYDPSQADGLTWLTVIARSRAIDRLRKARNSRSVSLSEAHSDGLESEDPGPAESIIDAETPALVRGALGRLPEKQRTAIVSAFYGGLSHAQVAAELGLPLGTVKSRIRGGLQCLRAYLDQHDEGAER